MRFSTGSGEHEGSERLQGLFTELIREAMCSAWDESVGVPLHVGGEDACFRLTIEGWTRQWRAEGEAKGRTEGKAEALISLLAGRFGAVAPSWRERIRAAEIADARTLDRACHCCTRPALGLQPTALR